jgi:uncharacterized membrane protein
MRRHRADGLSACVFRDKAFPVTTTKGLAADPGRVAVLGVALIFFAACTWASYAHWANFEYRTFDLAYYVQALWQLIHGRFEVSVEGVPLLGNHVEPIVVLIVPLFALFRHPMAFVLFQNAALAAMGPVAFSIARRIGMKPAPALLLAIALLITPATGYVALHEFHPEALTAPCLLLMIHARLRNSLRAHWLWLIALLACKENMALLVAAYCAVHLVLERKRPLAELRSWYIGPLALSILWFLLCTKVITPALNSETIDYLALYDRLGKSAGDIAIKSITDPQRIIGALGQSLRNGNLLWAMLFPFLGLSLLRPRWLLIAAPVLLQHLLSWRSSEWTTYFHYAAPLIPLFWMALAQGVSGIEHSRRVPVGIRFGFPVLVVGACVAAQILVGPVGSIIASVAQWPSGQHDRARKTTFINQIPPAASVVAPLPYLSHLAMREKLYSLHYILKGLKTLSRSAYDPPPPTDFVLIDYDDSATFDPEAGYYHPAMKTVDGRVIPSSDRLLHDFLKRTSWATNSSNEMTLLRQQDSTAEVPVSNLTSAAPIEIGPRTTLTGIGRTSDILTEAGLEIQMNWSFQEERDFFPWMFLKLTSREPRPAITIARGLCAIERTRGAHSEKWRVIPHPRIPPGDYSAEAVFLDYAKLLWAEKSGPRNAQPPPNSVRVPLGQIKVMPSGSSGN